MIMAGNPGDIRVLESSLNLISPSPLLFLPLYTWAR